MIEGGGESGGVRDERFMRELRRLAAEVDPVPPAVGEAARASLTWRTIDSDLAELSYDSLMDDARMAAVRSGGGPRLLTFETPRLTIDVEVIDLGKGKLRLVGQIIPPGKGTIEIRHPDGATVAEVDDRGRFSAGGFPGGSVSLLCRVGSEEGALSFETEWVTI